MVLVFRFIRIHMEFGAFSDISCLACMDPNRIVFSLFQKFLLRFLPLFLPILCNSRMGYAYRRHLWSEDQMAKATLDSRQNQQHATATICLCLKHTMKHETQPSFGTTRITCWRPCSSECQNFCVEATEACVWAMLGFTKRDRSSHRKNVFIAYVFVSRSEIFVC